MALKADRLYMENGREYLTVPEEVDPRLTLEREMNNLATSVSICVCFTSSLIPSEITWRNEGTESDSEIRREDCVRAVLL